VLVRTRVLWLIKGLGPGGAERLLVSAAAVHDRERFELEVAYLLPWKTALVADLKAAGITVHCLDVPRPEDPRFPLKLRRLLRDRNYDIVHAHSPVSAAVARLVTRTFPAHRRPKFVSTEHNVWSSHSRLTRLLNTLTFPIGDAWIAVSNEVNRSLPQRHQRRADVIVHGVVVDEVKERLPLRDEVRAELRLEPHELAVATVANFRSQKAYPDLLAAARIILDRGLPVRFVAVGQGPLEDEIRALHAELGLGDAFNLMGYQHDPIRILAGCDVFTMASHYEGYPVAIMEALAVGLPVVATTVGGIPEAVRDGVEGLLVPPSRPDLLAAALEELALDPDRRRRMAAAAAARGDAYDISSAIDRIEAIYDQVMGVGPGPHVGS
jgi:glycosyltransferase involved in cell wall biosynthesis